MNDVGFETEAALRHYGTQHLSYRATFVHANCRRRRCFACLEGRLERQPFLQTNLFVVKTRGGSLIRNNLGKEKI